MAKNYQVYDFSDAWGALTPPNPSKKKKASNPTSIADFRKLDQETQKEVPNPVAPGLSVEFAKAHPKINNALFDLTVQRNTPVHSPVYNNIEQFMTGLENGATLGLTGLTDRFIGFANPTPRTTAENVSRNVGEFAGSILPVSDLYGVGEKAVRLMPEATSTVGKLAQTGLRGSVAGGLYGGLEGTTNYLSGNGTLADISKNALTNAALFGTGDVALKGLGMGYNALAKFNNLDRINGLDLSPKVQTPLLPAGKTMGELPPGNVSGYLPGDVVYSQPGRVGQPTTLPMSRAESTVRSYMEPPRNLLTGAVDNSIRPEAPDAMPRLTEPAEDAMYRQYADQLRLSYPLNTQGKAQIDFVRATEDLAKQNRGFLDTPYAKQVQDAEMILKDYQTQRQNIVNGVTDSMRKAELEASKEPDIFKLIRQRGGIRPDTADLQGEFKYDIPASVKNKNGLPLDEMADELGMDQSELINVLSQGRPAPKDLAKEAESYLQNDKDFQALERKVTDQQAYLDELNANKPGNATETYWDVAKQQAAQQGKDLEDLYQTATNPEYAGWKDVVGLGEPAPSKAPVREPAQPTAELENARAILNKPVRVETAEKIFNAYPELRVEFPGIAKRVERAQTYRAKQAQKPAQKATVPPQTVDYERQNAINILRSNPTPERAQAIIKAYPDLAKYYKPSKAKKAQTQAADIEGGRWTSGSNGRVTTQPGRVRTMAEDMAQPEAATTTETPAGPARTGGNAGTFRERVDRNRANKPLKQRFTEMVKNLRTQFIDDLAPLERLEKNVTGEVASAENSLYKQARLFRGNPEKANEIVDNKLGKIIKNVENEGFDYKDLGDYALAVHARDVNAHGINSGFSNEEIADVISKYGTPEMEAARQELVKLNNDLLQSLADAGVIEPDLVRVLKEKYPNYVPLFRSFEDDKIEFASGLSKALANVTSPIKRLEGSGRKVIDPIENMVKNVFQTTTAVDRNKVAQQLARLADRDSEGLFVRRLPEGENRSRLNTVYVRENGQKVYYEVQPDVYKAIMSLDRKSGSMLIKMLEKPASILRAGATITPEFSFRNPMRDVVQAFVTNGFNPITDFPLALIDVIKSKRGKETIFNQFLRDNGGFGNIVSMDRKLHQETVKRMIKQPANKRIANILSLKSFVNLLRGIADTTESATKLGMYKRALKRGVSRQEAAYQARDLMDFSRAGVSIRQANRVVAFLNANIQGKSKLLRALKENPVGVTTRALTGITLPTVGTYLAQKYLANDTQKKYINGASTWLKDSFWLVPVPGTDQVARIPKPFDLAPIFANLPERLLNYLDRKDPQAFDKFGRETLSAFSIPVMLTGLMPFVEGMANYSFFMQGPIIPQREQDINYPDQYDINTTETAKAIAKGVNKLTGGEGAFKNFGSPRIVDNTIKGIAGGMGSYVTGAIDLIAEGTGMVDKKNKPAKKISEAPLARAFLVNETGTGKSMNDLYDAKDKLTRQKGSAESRNQKLPASDASKLKLINGAAKRLSNINKTMRQIENDKTMSPQAKRGRLDTLNNSRNEIARQTMEKIRKM